MEVGGKVGSLRIGSTGGVRDLNLSLFQTLWRDSRLSVLFGILFWALSTSFGLYNFLKNFIKAARKDED